MTEEEKRRREAVKFTPVVEDEERRRAEKADREAWQKSIDAQRQEAARLKKYASSPVKVNTEGQTKPYDEFLKNREAQRLVESDEQRAAREKKERSNRRLLALTDGLIALSNVTGAMFGATPHKQVSLSAAYHTSAKEAAERRRQNTKQYELARQKAIEAQRKQDKDNADRYNVEVKARADAGKRAVGIEQGIGKQIQAQRNADRKYQLAKDKADKAAKHQDVMEQQGAQRIALSQERNNISRSKGGRGGNGGGGSSSSVDPEAYRYWMSLTEDQKEQWRDANKRVTYVKGDIPEIDENGKAKKDADGNLIFPTTKKYTKDDAAFINFVWRQHKGELAQPKKQSPTGGSSNGGKKKSPTA